MTARFLIGRLLIVFHLVVLGGCHGGSSGGSNLPGSIQLAASAFDATEGTIVNIRVTRSGGSDGAVSVDYATGDATATEGTDYTAANGTLTWANGVTGNQTISIAIADDGEAEISETFTLTLSNVSRAMLGPNSSATVNILDDDTTALSAFGVITELNSATVNGIRYDTSGTNVIVNGQLAGVPDLRLGQVVALEGDANLSSASGTADVIEYSASVIGPVENIDATLDRLLVLGQTVLTNSDTVFDPAIDPDTFAGLIVGTTIQISGFRNAAGDIIATRIEPDTTSTGVQLIGAVSSLDLANMLFSVDRLTVDYSSATLIDLPTGMPADGLHVIARGALTNGILVVDEISGDVESAATPGERAYVSGLITRFASPTDFELNGFPVTTNSSTRFVNGVADDLRADTEITVDGEVGAQGNVVLANRITFGIPAPDRTVLTFDFENFTNISVFGLSRVIVVQGPDFSVEATGNADIINDIQVSQNGDTVTFGNDNTQILDAVVTMPILNEVDVSDNALANVTLNNFEQPAITLTLGGVSSLRGEGLVIDSLTATVSGVSLLELGGIRPIGNANIDVGGVSQATLNMDVGSSLAGSVTTGQGTGRSTLFYYGTSVVVNVTTDGLSSILRLGDTRP